MLEEPGGLEVETAVDKVSSVLERELVIGADGELIGLTPVEEFGGVFRLDVEDFVDCGVEISGQGDGSAGLVEETERDVTTGEDG